jgi:hypothetical protein
MHRQSLVHQPQDSKQQESGNTSLAIALKDRPVKHDPQGLRAALRRAFVQVGLREPNFPEAEEKELLISHVITHYGNHTAKELMLAFDLAITDKLDLPRKEVACYENFSLLYFSTIMNAYRRWADKEVKFIKQPPMIENKESLSDQSMREWFEETAKQVREGKSKVDFIPVMIHDWLKGKELIGDHEPYLKKAAEYKYKVLEGLAVDKEGIAAFTEYKGMYDSGCFEKGYVKELPALAKKMLVWDYILKNK